MERLRSCRTLANVDEAEHYLNEAQRCRDLAGNAPNGRLARRWNELADQYIILAEAITARRRVQSSRTAMQQPVQAPQGKLKNR